jgi:hypothetical protein
MDNRHMRNNRLHERHDQSNGNRNDRNACRNRRVRELLLVVMLALPIVVGSNGCGGGGTGGVLNGTPLNGKRLFILLPKQDGFTLQNPDAYAYSRGISEMNASTRLFSEMRSMFADELGQRYDSNTVLNYNEQAISGTVPLDAVNDFNGASDTWNWDNLNRAGKEGAVDFLLVMHSVVVSNQKPSGEIGMGRESISASFHLIDPINKVNVRSATVSISVDDPRIPSDSYVFLARQVASRLPFLNSTY